MTLPSDHQAVEPTRPPIVGTPAGSVANPAATPQVEQFIFDGSGSEYFGIWIVNLLLTIVTFGIYSAWAKVRKAKYMYGATSLDGTAFEYHGNPLAILKGRAIALLLVIGYQGTLVLSKPVGLVVFGAFMLAMPWLVWKSLQYKLHNSSFRAIRFSFRGTLGGAYTAFLGWPFLNVFTLGLLSPFVHQRLKQYQHGEAYFGSARFRFDASVGAFYRRYLLALLLALAGIGAIVCVLWFSSLERFGLVESLAVRIKLLVGMVGGEIWLFTLFPLFFTLLQNLIWSHTTLEGSRFASRMKWSRMTFIAITNVLAIIFSLGLFIPFAQIRSMRYRISSLSVAMTETLDHFTAAPAAELTATGEGVSDLLGFDISL